MDFSSIAYRCSCSNVSVIFRSSMRLRNIDMTPEQHVINCAIEVIEGYEFKFTNILDAGGRCIHHRNRVAIHQLDRALTRLEESNEQQ